MAELPHLSLALQSQKGGITGTAMEGKISGSSDPGTPLNLAIVDLIEDIGRVLRSPEIPEIRRIWQKASKQAGLHPRWTPRGMPCPRCVSREFGGFAGEERLACRECGFTISTDKWHGLCLAVIDAEKK